MAVVLLGTFDTKGNEFRFVRELLQALNIATLTIDAGSQQPPAFAPDVSREQVFKAAGTTIDAILRTGDRGKAVEAAAAGAAKIVLQLHQQGKVDGILGLGGSAGTVIATSAMRALPFGIPKLRVSTLASGQVKPYVGVRDILMMHTVVDIIGLNRISRTVLSNAAHAMAGMVSHPASAAAATDRPLLAATMFGVTTPCVSEAQKQLEGAGYEMLVFHATGTGGMTMESFIRDGLVQGVLDITTTELADELVGGILGAGKDRLTAAAMKGIPQVISLGALDMVNFGPRDTVPEKFKARRFYQHNATVTLMRTTPEENDKLGKEIAEKASAASGPTAVLIPLRGVSAIDREGQPFWWPEADHALFQSIRNWIGPMVKLVELDLHINDPQFATQAATLLQSMLASGA
ncbi:MAG: Tm-1-like ATP-binding domain-containing protein [Gemmataceae bacterium]